MYQFMVWKLQLKNAEKLIEKSINKIIDLDGNFNKKSLIEICNFIISRDN